MKESNENKTPFDLLQEMNAKGKTRVSKELYIGNAVNIEEPGNTKIERFHVKNSDRGGHLGVLGTTRIGKTRLLEHLISQDIMAGNNVIVIDPKVTQSFSPR